jgi:hypothetical protein
MKRDLHAYALIFYHDGLSCQSQIMLQFDFEKCELEKVRLNINK